MKEFEIIRHRCGADVSQILRLTEQEASSCEKLLEDFTHAVLARVKGKWLSISEQTSRSSKKIGLDETMMRVSNVDLAVSRVGFLGIAFIGITYKKGTLPDKIAFFLELEYVNGLIDESLIGVVETHGDLKGTLIVNILNAPVKPHKPYPKFRHYYANYETV